MSLERLFKTLKRFGLNRSEAKIYIYLAKKGPRKANDICTETKNAKQQVYACLENLQSRGVVNVTSEHPAIFHAVPFEKVLEMVTGQKIGEATEAHRNKTALLKTWQNMKAERD